MRANPSRSARGAPGLLRVSRLAYKVVDMTIGLRVAEDEEREGLDITYHGETAYAK